MRKLLQSQGRERCCALFSRLATLAAVLVSLAVGDAKAQVTPPDLQAEIAVSGRQFLTLPASVPLSQPRPEPGYVAVLVDYAAVRVYVYDRLLFTEADVGQALNNLIADLGIDLITTVTASANPMLNQALADAAALPTDPTAWLSATAGQIMQVMEFDPPQVDPQTGLVMVAFGPDISELCANSFDTFEPGQELPPDFFMLCERPGCGPGCCVGPCCNDPQCCGDACCLDPCCPNPCNCSSDPCCPYQGQPCCPFTDPCCGIPVSCPVFGITAPTGPARRWEAGLPVGPFSQVNLRTGRVWTSIPIVGWGGKGPPISFSLFHNMKSDWSTPTSTAQILPGLLGDANGDGSVTTSDVDPFVDIMLSSDPTEDELAVADFDGNQTVDSADLDALVDALALVQADPVWTHTYSTCLVADLANGVATVIWGDGTKDTYAYDSVTTTFTPPPGVFSTLTFNAGGFAMTTKAQSRFLFDSAGRLRSIVDPSGNAVTCVYGNGCRLDYVKDAADRVLLFDYLLDGRLSKITGGLNRVWQLLYADSANPGIPAVNGDGAFIALDDPIVTSSTTPEEVLPFHRINIAYNTDGDITTMGDKEGNAYQFAYDSGLGRLQTVTDPALLTQQFGYFATAQPDAVRGEFTDVRGKIWTLNFDPDGNLTRVTNPLNEAQTLAYASPLLIHEATGRTNALGKTWTVGYDAVANVTSVTDPLNQRWAYGYDEYNANGVGGLNNLSSITPPLDNTGALNPAKRVEIHYENPFDPNDELPNPPTSPTRIVSPAAPTGSNGDMLAATTTIEYYGTATDPSGSIGLVKQVTGPNLVKTLFEYDDFGQPESELENPDAQAVGQPFTPLPGGTGPVGSGTTYNDAGDLIGAYHSIGACGDCDNIQPTIINLDAMGQSTGSVCPAIICSVNSCENSLAILAAAGAVPYSGPPLSSGCFSQQLSANGLPTTITRCIADPLKDFSSPDQSRDLTIDYDAFDRPTLITLETTEPTDGVTAVTRSFENHYDDLNGNFNGFDQDGNAFRTTSDDAGRIKTVSRTITRAGGMVTLSASYLYDAAGRVKRIDYGNGTRLSRVYDNAGRVMQIQYVDIGAHAFIKLDYTFTADGLVKRIVETDLVSNNQVLYGPTILQAGVTPQPIVAQVDFEYDNRNRLTRETRTVTGDFDTDLGPSEYDLSYTYDLGGNRLTKSNGLTGRVTTYVYDIETDNAIDNGQHNNRLLGYDVADTAGGEPLPVEQTRYKYGPAGNVMLLVKQLDLSGDGVIDQNDLAAVWWFYYSSSNQLWLAVQGTANFDEATGTLTATTFVKAAEYRYDGGRQRYLVRQRDPMSNFAIIGSGAWRDYMGNNIYNDYTVDQAGTVTNGTGYLPGIGFDDPSMTDAPAYYGSDLIGTTRRISNSAPYNPDDPGVTGGPPAIYRAVLTAFGEPISSAGIGNTRYGYAGAWGYESPEQSFDPLAELGWLHVGERYYDPAVGRFMQRDPIGIRGGWNVYEYVRSSPAHAIDPDGLDIYDDIITGIETGLDIGIGTGGIGSATAQPLNYKYVWRIGKILNRISAACVGAFIGRAAGKLLVAYTPIEDIGAHVLIAGHTMLTFPDGIVIKPKPPGFPGQESCLKGCHDGA